MKKLGFRPTQSTTNAILTLPDYAYFVT